MNCRFTHVYTEGPAPYYTFAGAYRHGADPAATLAEIRAGVSDAVTAASTSSAKLKWPGAGGLAMTARAVVVDI